ncbi:MAG TPA: DNA-binding protein WhiA [Ruminiclostridium sp.]|nr:DNA-binding protein WhiA [Ruminiclostridium sp.]
MSFSTIVKDELCRIELHEECCMKAEILGVILTGNLFSHEKNTRATKVVTENAAFARRLYSIFRRIYGISPEVAIRRNSRLKKHVSYSLLLATNQGLNKILYDFGISAFSEGEYVPTSNTLRKVCCRKSFLRAAFLSGGSISDPEKTYHLEIATHNEMSAEIIRDLLSNYDINTKIITRKGSYVAYIKEGEQIVDFLNIIGAHGALMELENVRILKDMRNSVNRIVNCETANLEKTVNASIRQIENIKYIQSTIGLGKLPENLVEIANIRLEYSDASLKELGEMLHPKLGKSGVNHRLRKLDEIAEKIRKNSER